MLRRSVVLLALVSVLLSACGGDNGSSATTGGGGTTATTGATGATASTGATGATATTGSGGSANSAECVKAAAALTAASQDLPNAMSGSPTDLDKQLQVLQAYAEAAPDEIKGDLQTIVDAYSKLVDALTTGGYDPSSGQVPPPEVIAALTQVSQQFDSADFKGAVQHVEDYFSSCQQ
jgi:hypothetical protein